MRWIAPFLICALAAPAGAEVLDHPGLYEAGTHAALPYVRAAAHIDVRGPIAQVQLTQTYANPGKDPIEAVYVFPLPDDAAVGAMTMTVGDRTIRASIRKRADAEKVYSDAKANGQTASLLEQERPNVFTQSVANILGGEEIRIELTYDVLLAPANDVWELAIPTVVAPRHVPDGVADADRITPPVDAAAVNPISFDLDLEPGMPIADVFSPTHTIDVAKISDTHDQVRLTGGATASDRDFVLRWRVAVTQPALDVLANHGDDGGYLALLVQPPPTTKDAGPRELVFVVDTSGSMDGAPLDLAKQAMTWALARLGRDDTFKVLHFSDDVAGLDDGDALEATDDNVQRGLAYVDGMRSDGGTEMLPALRAALRGDHAGRTRYVCFLSDGDVGNEADVLAALDAGMDADTHFFSMGIGSSANRYVLDELAHHGHGVAQVLLLDQDPAPEIEQFFAQVEAPELENLTVTWEGLDVTDPTPAALPDLFAGQPLAIAARYAKGGKGRVKVHGTRGGDDVTLQIPVVLPDDGGDGDVLSRLWARRRIAELTDEDAITELALAHSLMTSYTSFVAVEDGTRTDGTPTTVEVPTAVPYGMAMENSYYVDGAATSELMFVAGIAGGGERRWRASVDVGYGSQLSLSASVERHDAGDSGAIGLTGVRWSGGLTTLLLTFARWAFLEQLDLRFGLGGAWFDGDGPALGWQVRLARPILQGRFAPEVELRLDGTALGDDPLFTASLGLGARF